MLPEDRRSKRLIDPLVDVLRSMASALKEILEQQKTANRYREQSSNKSDTSPEPTVPEPQADGIPAETGKSKEKRDGPSPWLALWVQIALCIFTAGAFGAAVYYAKVAKLQKNEMITANKIARETQIASQRAYVVFRGLSSVRAHVTTSKGTGIQWAFRVTLQNVGPTPAIEGVHDFMTDIIPGELTEEKFIGTDIGRAKTRLSVFGPQQPLTLGPEFASKLFMPGTGEEVTQTMNLSKQFDKGITQHSAWWGWLAYKDTLPDTPFHLTEFCQELGGVTIDPKNPTQSAILFGDCREHNCYDEHCADYALLTSKLK